MLGFHKTNSFDIGKMMARTDSEFKQRCEKRTKSKEVNNKRDLGYELYVGKLKDNKEK